MGESDSDPVQATIRPATAADAEVIAQVHVASWRETYPGLVPPSILAGLSVAERAKMWRKILRQPDAFQRSAVFVAERSGAVIGFAACGDQRSSKLETRGFAAEIFALYLLRSDQGLGLGRLLMAELARTLAGRVQQGASLWVLRENLAARRFYERLGGELVGEKEDRREEGILVEVAYGWTALDRLLG